MIWRPGSSALLLELVLTAYITCVCSAETNHLPFDNSSNIWVDEHTNDQNASGREAIIHTSSAANEIHITEPKEWFAERDNNPQNRTKPIYLSDQFQSSDASTNNDADLEDQAFGNSSVIDELVSKLLGNDNPINQIDTDQLSVITASTPSPYVQVISITSPQPEPDANADSQLDNDSYLRDLNDRHIQYDMVPQPVADQPSSRGERQKLHPRQVSPNEGEEKLSNYKLDSEGNDEKVGESQNQTQSFALDVLRAAKGTFDETNSKLEERADQMREPQKNTTEPEVGQKQDVNAMGSSKETLTSATAAATISVAGGRTGNVQARSMSSIPVAPSSAKGPHTKPPYASYDQFHQRAYVVAASQSQQGLDYETPSVNLTVASPNSSTASNQEASLGINRMSGQSLANEVTRNLRSKQPDGRDQQQTSSEDKQLLHKLASINQPIDLNPIPVSPGGSLTGSEQPESDSNRFYFSKGNQLFNFYLPQQQVHNHRGPSERYSSSPDGHESPFDEISRASMNNHLEPSGHQRRPNDDTPPVEFSTYFSPPEQEHHRPNSPSSGLTHQNNQQGSNKHYAASLINVTAPMIPPLSATEAMEASLGDQTLKNLMHHVSGFIRPQAPPSSTGDKGGQLRQSLYFMPTGVSESQLQSIYSQPANQYSPKPPSGSSFINSEAASQEQNSTASYLEERMRLDRNNNYLLSGRKPAPTSAYVAPNMTQTHQASGFRSPLHSSLLASASSASSGGGWPSTRQPVPTNYLNMPNSLSSAFSSGALTPAASMSSPSTYSEVQQHFSTTPSSTEPATIASLSNSSVTRPPVAPSAFPVGQSNSSTSPTVVPSTLAQVGASAVPQEATGLSKRVNLTRVEHISAECSNDLIRTVIVFNGTFKGIIYSSGYVRDPNCLYINGTGKTKYDFSIRMNQCGTLGKQKLINPSAGPNDVRRRDQLMWNTLSIQYNPIIEQEWDEHFRVSCEYGSDFWKTISFNPFNVETNTGHPVIFTVDPPTCQMDIIRGHGVMGPRQEAVSGPVTVGDPLTLLIHMKSEKAGYDILVKNCIAHNGGHQKMQLIDSNGCVVNERFISPFRGTYNDNDMKHVTLYSYLKAFRFTGSPVLYLECEIHMCQSSCPPQMCYWRRLSKRSANETHLLDGATYDQPDQPELSDKEPTQVITTTSTFFPADRQPRETLGAHRANRTGKRRLRNLDFGPDEDEGASGLKVQRPKPTPAGSISDSVSLFQALEVRQERDPEVASYSTGSLAEDSPELLAGSGNSNSLMCYRRAEVLAFLFTAGSVFLVAISVTIGCCLRAANLRKNQGKQLALDTSISSANVSSSKSSSPLSHGSSSSLCSISRSAKFHSADQASDAIYRQQSMAQQLSPCQSALSAMVPMLQQHSSRHKVRPY